MRANASDADDRDPGYLRVLVALVARVNAEFDALHAPNRRAHSHASLQRADAPKWFTYHASFWVER